MIYLQYFNLFGIGVCLGFLIMQAKTIRMLTEIQRHQAELNKIQAQRIELLNARFDHVT